MAKLTKEEIEARLTLFDEIDNFLSMYECSGDNFDAEMKQVEPVRKMVDSLSKSFQRKHKQILQQ